MSDRLWAVGWPCPRGRHTHGVCAAAGLRPGPLGLLRAQDGIPDEEREGAGQLLVGLGRTVLAAQQELGPLPETQGQA